ncbi:MAG: tRNA glutamyl-Q(34) synthetase GluQRS [Mariprofundaceae bacterium]|nr:tRNA glutamyl-Q(34) synthetase GluQRS [Mariprofundaceae bacterium]
MLRTRFAPSPTGYLHVGNALSALYCQQWAKNHHAQLLLRIEDIDSNRCRGEFSVAIIEDLQWLGLHWHGEIRYQSRHLDAYRQALARLRRMQVIYPCFCTRRDIQQEIQHLGLAPHTEDSIPHYPGTCRRLSAAEQHYRQQTGQAFAWRIDIGRALEVTGPLHWTDEHGQKHTVGDSLNDAIIGRKDIGFSYHLAVVIDDAAQGVSHVIRGEDLRSSTDLHRLLQALLNLPTPVYIHHPLLCDTHGERLAKRNHAPSLRNIRTSGIAADTLHRMLFPDGMQTPPTWTGLASGHK